MDAVLNDNADGFNGRAGRITPRATETVPVTDVRAGDTVIDTNSHGVPVYRVVSASTADPLNKGHWTLSFDVGRNVAGPGEDWTATISHGSLGVSDTSTIERVSDLGNWEMAEVARLRPLDQLADGRGLWEVARQVSTDKQILVRFAGSDNFVKMRPGTVVLVEGRRINVDVEQAMKRSERLRMAQRGF